MLNPVFSSNHLREMVPTFYEVTYKVWLQACVCTPFTHLGLIQLRDAIASKLKGGPQDIDILH
jgi:hypothetical protein